MTVITSFKDVSVIIYASAFTNPFNRGFGPYVKAYIALSITRSGNATIDVLFGAFWYVLLFIVS